MNKRETENMQQQKNIICKCASITSYQLASSFSTKDVKSQCTLNILDLDLNETCSWMSKVPLLSKS